MSRDDEVSRDDDVFALSPIETSLGTSSLETSSLSTSLLSRPLPGVLPDNVSCLSPATTRPRAVFEGWGAGNQERSAAVTCCPSSALSAMCRAPSAVPESVLHKFERERERVIEREPESVLHKFLAPTRCQYLSVCLCVYVSVRDTVRETMQVPAHARAVLVIKYTHT